MRGQTVILDSSNLAAVVADATGEPHQKEAEEPKKEEAAKTEKAEPAKADAKTESEESEDENGLTVAQRKELTEKMQKAIGKKHRAWKEAEEFAEDQYKERRMAEQRAEQLEREIARIKTELAPKQQAQEQAEPKRENFQSDQEFLDARIQWGIDQGLKKREQEQALKQEQDRLKQVADEATKRISKAKELVDDFQEAIEGVDLEIPNHIAGYMQESEMLAELAYHFAKNPEVAEKLAKLPPAKGLVEIGKIEAKLKPFSDNAEKQPEKEAVKSDGAKPSKQTAIEPSVTTKPRASEPISPLPTGSGTQVDKDPRDRSYAEERSAWSRKNKVNFSLRQRH